MKTIMKHKKRLVHWCTGALVLFRGRRPLTGFTLVEILIAVTLIIVIGVATFITFRGGTAAWQQGTAHAQRQAGVRAALEMMSREISKAILVAADGAYQIDFVGAASTIYFIGSLETPRLGQPDLMRVRYALGGPNLGRASARIAHGDITVGFPAAPPTLASDITGLTFDFFDAQSPFTGSPLGIPHWRDAAWRAANPTITPWDSRTTAERGATQDPATVNTLPDAVRITLTSDPEGPLRGLPAKNFFIITELPRAAPEPFSFVVSLSPSSGSVVQGGSVTSTVRVELTGGTAETVTLQPPIVTFLGTGVGTGVTASLSPTPLSGTPPFTRTLTLTAGPTATLGTYRIEVQGSTGVGGISESAFYTLTVFSPFNFSLSVSPTVVSVGRPTTATPGHSDPTVTVTATLALNAEPREITFSPPTGVPAGTTVTISPLSGIPTFSALLAIDITTGTPLGDHLITISATGGGITQNVNFSLRVFDFSLAVGSISSGQGGSQGTTVTATLTAGSGTAASVATSHEALPAGVGITGHGSITPTWSIPLTVATTTATPLGNHLITINATGGGITRTATFTLSVFNLASLSAPALTILRGAPPVGHPVSATLAAGPPASGTPARVTLSGTAISGPTGFNPAHITIGTGAIINFPSGSTGGSTNLTVTTASGTVLGNYTIRISATCNGGVIVHETTFTLSVFDYILSVSPNISVVPGGSGTTTVTATLTGGSGTAASVETSHGALPAGVTITGHGGIIPALSPGATRALTVGTTTATPPGAHTITITATGGGGTRSGTFTLTIVDFSVSVSPTSIGVWEGLTSSAVTVTVSGHLPAGQTVSLSVTSGLPTGATASFSHNNLAPPFTSSLTIRTSADGEFVGPFTVTITGTGGGLTRSTPLALTVHDAPSAHWHRDWWRTDTGAHLGTSQGTGHADAPASVGPINRPGEFDHNYGTGNLPRTPFDASINSSVQANNIQFWSIREIHFPREGWWHFWLSSDDGSILRVGDEMVIDGWAGSGTRNTSRHLSAGWRTLRISYWQGPSAARVTFRFMGPPVPIREVSAGWYHTVAVGTDGTLWAWGEDDFGRLGLGSSPPANPPFPIQVGTLNTWSTEPGRLAAGGEHTLAIRTDGTLWAWGRNSVGQLGVGDWTDRWSPTQVTHLHGGVNNNWRWVSAGRFHSMGIRADGSLWAWGEGRFSRLGLNSETDRNIPHRVDGTSTNWSRVSAGEEHTLAIRTNGTLWAWGRNWNGQLGLGDWGDRWLPTQVGNLTTWSTGPGRLSAGTFHSMAIRTDGSLWAWGYNGSGRLGDGSTTTRNTPVRIGAAITTWSRVSAGDAHTLATRTDGTLWAWGYRGHGRLGDGTDTTRTSPVQVTQAPATNWDRVSAGRQHSMGIRTDGTEASRRLWAWGLNNVGQLGLNDTTNRLSPVQGTVWE